MVCSEMMCREFGEGWITSAAIERMVLSLQKGQPAGEHAIDEQRVDDEQSSGVSSVGSKQRISEKSMLMMRKKSDAPIHSSSHLSSWCSVTTTAEKTGFETVSRGMAREVGAPLRRPRCGQQRRRQEAEGDGSAAVRRSIVLTAPFLTRPRVPVVLAGTHF